MLTLVTPRQNRCTKTFTETTADFFFLINVNWTHLYTRTVQNSGRNVLNHQHNRFCGLERGHHTGRPVESQRTETAFARVFYSRKADEKLTACRHCYSVLFSCFLYSWLNHTVVVRKLPANKQTQTKKGKRRFRHFNV